MTSPTTRRPFRVAIVTFALALATTLGASADVLTPLEEVGAPGGGGGIGGQYDEMLAGSGYESAEAQANAPTVAEVRSAQIAGSQEGPTTASSSFEDLSAVSSTDALAGSGYESAATVAQHPTQNAQSIDRIESTQTATGALAGGDADESADTSQAPQAQSPYASAF